MKRNGWQGWACALLGIFVAGTVGYGIGRGSLLAASETMRFLKDDAYEQPTAQQLDRAASEGMVLSLEDEMAAYLTAEQMRYFSLRIQGEKMVGLGVELAISAQGYYVCNVLAHSPAQMAGLARGDVIVSIDGASVLSGAPWPLMEEGQQIVLGIDRNGVKRVQTLFAKTIDPFPDVEQSWLNESVGLVRIRSFEQQGMEAQAIDALATCLKRGDAILDLRHNPGGRLDAALTIAQAFVPKGEPLCTLQLSKNRSEAYKSKDGTLSDSRLLILVDRQTASAAEVLAGILQHYGVGVLVGETTYGKGTVQRVTPLSNDDGLRFTIGEYVLPDGKRVREGGLSADIACLMAEMPGWAYAPSQDVMLQMALTHIQPVPVP